MRETNLLNCLNTAGAGVGAPSYRMLTDLDVATHCDGHGCWLLESAAVFRSDRPDRGVRFATDSPLEESGFEFSVPPEIGHPLGAFFRFSPRIRMFKEIRGRGERLAGAV
jgi:hypothetical protein